MMNNPFVYAFLSPESDDKIICNQHGELPDESLKRKNKALSNIPATALPASGSMGIISAESFSTP